MECSNDKALKDMEHVTEKVFAANVSQVNYASPDCASWNYFQFLVS
jgi:hypothetical protein